MTVPTDRSVPTELTLPLEPERADWLKGKIRDIPDFPKPGIIFKDITTLLKDREGFRFCVEALAHQSERLKPDYIAGIEARGFILGATVAHVLGVGFLPIRKPGKLPYETVQIEYELEYGTDKIEMHVDAVDSGERVVLIDDLLATGGTAAGAVQLLDKIGATLVGSGFVVELGFLKGRTKLDGGGEVFSLLCYD